MPTLTAKSFDVTGDDVIDVLAGGVIWDLPETRVLHWALADGFDEDVWVDRAKAIQTFGDALTAIQQFIDVEFTYLGDFGNPIDAGEAGAELVYTLDNAQTNDGTLAYAYFPGPGVFEIERYASEGGDVFMNFSERLNVLSSFESGSDGFVTVIHEIGHALGLRHPFEDTDGRPSVARTGRGDILDIDWMTVMSYSDPFESELEKWDPATPMVLDVLALQFLFGANAETHSGDTRHQLDAKDYYYTIWDSAGTDLVDVSAMTEGWTVVLPDLQFSTLVDTRAGLAMASNEYSKTFADIEPTQLVWLMGDIEDAIGTAHDDTLSGNVLDNRLSGEAGDDVLEGRAGDDILDGGAGLDISLHSAAQRSHTLTLRPDGVTIEDRRSDGEGTDVLVDIELLHFDGDLNGQAFDLRQSEGAATLSGADLETLIELYIAYFNRAPDAVGLSFWGTAIASGVTLEQAATYFVDQDETRATYPADLGNTEFATAVYNNVLGRTPDQAGLEFWTGKLDSGGVARDQFIVEVLRGAKADPDPSQGQDFIDQQLTDRAYLATKTDIGAHYAVHRGLSDVEDAASAMVLFDGTQGGVTAAVAAIDGFHSAALDPESGAFLMPLVGVLDNPFDLAA